MPLGMARINIGNATQDVVVIDTDEMGLVEILSLEHDAWHSVGETYRCKISDSPWVESHPDFGSVRSVPVFAKSGTGRGVSTIGETGRAMPTGIFGRASHPGSIGVTATDLSQFLDQ